METGSVAQKLGSSPAPVRPEAGREAAARRFVIQAVGLAGALLGGVALFNYFVDPYGVFGQNRLGVYISSEREFKPQQVQSYHHDALLAGNSRMAFIPPEELNGFRFYNAGFGAATLEEVYYFLYHFARKEKLVILGVELGQLDPQTLQGDIFAPRTLSWDLNNLLNFRTVEYSVGAIRSRLAGAPTFLRTGGAFNATCWLQRMGEPEPARVAYIVAEVRKVSWNYPASDKPPMTFLTRIAELLRQRRITCVVVVPPLYEGVASGLREPARAARYQRWRNRLHEIFPLVVDLSVSSYCAEENFFKRDPVHFTPEAGVRMLNTEVIPVAERAMRGSDKTNSAR